MKFTWSYILILFVLFSCRVSKSTKHIASTERSGSVARYTGMINEFQDGTLILNSKEHFSFYKTTWMLFNIRHPSGSGSYAQKEDTIYLNWYDSKSFQSDSFLSGRCVIDSSTKMLWFLEEQTGKRIWGMHLRSNE